MNRQRRARLKKVFDQLSDIVVELEAIKDEEESAFGGMPENLQSSERGEFMQALISDLEEAHSNAESARDMVEASL